MGRIAILHSLLYSDLLQFGVRNLCTSEDNVGNTSGESRCGRREEAAGQRGTPDSAGGGRAAAGQAAEAPTRAWGQHWGPARRRSPPRPALEARSTEPRQPRAGPGSSQPRQDRQPRPAQAPWAPLRAGSAPGSRALLRRRRPRPAPRSPARWSPARGAAMVPPPLSPPLCTLPPGPGPPRFVCYCEGEGSEDRGPGDFNL